MPRYAPSGRFEILQHDTVKNGEPFAARLRKESLQRNPRKKVKHFGESVRPDHVIDVGDDKATSGSF